MKKFGLMLFFVLFFVTFTYAATPLAVRHISFDDNFGGAAYIDDQGDISGDIQIAASGGVSGFGKYGNFLNPARVNAGDSLQFPIEHGNNGTVAMWVSAQAGSSWPPRLWDASAVNHQWSAYFSYLDPYNANIYTRTSSAWEPIQATVPLNQWFHYAFTWSRSPNSSLVYTCCYINGNLVSSRYQTWNPAANVINVGGAFSTYHKFAGKMDEFYLFDTALTSQQISNYLLGGLNAKMITNPYPYAGSTVKGRYHTLCWKAPSGVASAQYKVYISPDSPSFSNVTPVVTSQMSVDVAVEADRTYYWRVDVVDGSKTYEGLVWSFVPEYLAGDIDEDGFVNYEDIAVMSGNWNTQGAGSILPGDLNGDFAVNTQDLFRFSQDWLKQGNSIEMNVSLAPVADAMSSVWGQDFIMPTPKSLQRSSDRFALSSNTKIYIGQGCSDVLRNAIDFMLEDLAYYYGIAPVVLEQEAPVGAVNAIIVGDAGRYDLPGSVCSGQGIAVPSHEDGYQLLASIDRIYVAGKSEQGSAYGIMTLLQLSAKDHSGLYFKGAKISDYPAMNFRGIHLFTSKNSADQLCKTVRHLMTRYKINKMVWQCDFINWDCTPNLHSPYYGMSKASAQTVKDEAARGNIEIIPLIASLGHAGWMFYNGQNSDLAEDPSVLYAYCPTNPDTYDFIFEVFQEAIDFFNPRMFHVGHDEVDGSGLFPCRSAYTGLSAAQLITQDTIDLRNWFTARNIKTTLWGDMFLYATEASSAANANSLTQAMQSRAALPKDITFCDWHYEINPPAAFTSLPLLNNEGFDVIAASWYKPGNISGLAQAIVDNDLEGLLQTTWAWYSFYVDGNEASWKQFWAYLWAAEYAWTGQNISDADLDFSAPQLFVDQWKRKKPLDSDKAGYLFDLEPLCNIEISCADGVNWLGAGSSADDLRGFPVGKNLFVNTNYYISENKFGQSGVLFRNTLNLAGDYPESITLKTNSFNASQLRILMTSVYQAAENKNVGKVVIKYADGTSAEFNLYYGKQVYATNDERVSGYAEIVWREKSESGRVICAHEACFVNPYPEKQISDVTIQSTDSGIGLMLLGITSVE